MTRRTHYRVLALVLALAPGLPCTPAPPHALAFAQDEYPLRLFVYNFQRVSVAFIIQKIAEPECIKIVFDDSVLDYVKSTQMDLRLTNASPMRALAMVLDSQALKYEYTADRDLVVFRGSVPRKVVLMNFEYRNTPFVATIAQFSELLKMKIRLHSSVTRYRRPNVTISLTGGSLLGGLERILSSQQLTYEYIDCNTIIVFVDESTRLT